MTDEQDTPMTIEQATEAIRAVARRYEAELAETARQAVDEAEERALYGDPPQKRPARLSAAGERHATVDPRVMKPARSGPQEPL